MTITRILLPTDFSHLNNAAVDVACSLAEKYDAELHVLHVIENLSEYMADFAMGLDLAPLKEAFRNDPDVQELDTFARLENVLDPQWKQGRSTTISIRRGKPFPEIVRYAKENGVEMIVMGTHGHTGLAHAMLGSVAENVVRHASCSVLTARSPEHHYEPL